MIVLATDAPLDSRQLGRLVPADVSRAGAHRRHAQARQRRLCDRLQHCQPHPAPSRAPDRHPDRAAGRGPLLNGLFQAVSESVEEAVPQLPRLRRDRRRPRWTRGGGVAGGAGDGAAGIKTQRSCLQAGRKDRESRQFIAHAPLRFSYRTTGTLSTSPLKSTSSPNTQPTPPCTSICHQSPLVFLPSTTAA